jgi:hypothetical protein
MAKGINPYAAKSSDRVKLVKASEPAVEPVPAGTAAEILAWVDSDTERAQRALDAEHEGNQRKTLIKKLEEILDVG